MNGPQAHTFLDSLSRQSSRKPTRLTLRGAHLLKGRPSASIPVASIWALRGVFSFYWPIAVLGSAWRITLLVYRAHRAARTNVIGVPLSWAGRTKEASAGRSDRYASDLDRRGTRI